MAALRALVRLFAVLVLAGWASAAASPETPIPSAPNAWATDTAGLLSASTVSDLNVRLRAYERQTGHQILVYVAPTTGGVPIEDWAVRAFERWKVGRKGLDDGLVLFIFARDRTLRIEVGYGLESRIPDVLASRIIRETIVPALRAGQPDRGVTEGVDRILRLAGGTAGGEAGESVVVLGPVQLAFIVLVLVALAAIAVRSPWFALSLLVNIVGRRENGFSGGGGFTGGGGRSGGGGASGRW